MAETTCLMQPFSYAAGIPPDDSTKGNPIHALGHSVSFGRFMSEPLQWEKWSTFSHNKYVEEAERFSRPGSVAQMKAFFEEHYRNLAARKAAALFEQADSAVPDENPNQDSQMVNTEDVVHRENVNSAVPDENSNQDSEMVKTEDVVRSENVEINHLETGLVPDSETDNKIQDPGLENQAVHDVEDVKEMEKPLLKDFISRKDESDQPSKKKPAVFSSRSGNGKTSKVNSTPGKTAASVRTRKEASATPTSKKSAADLIDRRKQTPKSTQKSMNFTPVREINRLTSTIMRKIDSSRVGSSSKDCSTPIRTATKLSVLKEHQYSLATPQPEVQRAETPVHPAVSGSKTVRSKWNFLPTDCSKFMSGSRNKTQSPNVTPFSFRTEERAARRKEKLEEKFNASQAQKVQLQATLKKAEAELKKLRKSLGFKARPLPDFYKEISASMKTTNDQIKKVPFSDHQPTKREKNSTTTNTSQFPRKSAVRKTSQKPVPEKDGQKSRSLASRLNTIISHENTSPNIRRE